MVELSRRRLISMAGLSLASVITPGANGLAEAKAAGLVEVDIKAGSLRLGLPDMGGTIHELADYRGRVTVVSFWATWCPPCRKEMPSLSRLSVKLPRDEFSVLAVNMGDDRERVSAFLGSTEHQGLTVLLDEKIRLMTEWYLRGLPAAYILDASGDVRYVAFGEREWDSEEIAGAIRALAKS